MDATLYNDAVSLLKELIEIPSYSKEEQDTASVIEKFLSSHEVKTSRLKNNIWARNKYYDSAKPTILLNSHHDTVKPGKDYTNNPFAAIAKDEKLFGLGSNDAGGCLVSLIAAFLYFNEKNDLKYNLILAATAEEEISGTNGIEALLPQLPPVDFAIVGEPTLMNMAIAEKGLMVVDCVVHGESGHAARGEGVNAIYKAMEDLEWFKNYIFPKVSELLGPVKMSVTIINAGTQHNVVPATCNFSVDIRINEHYTHEEILDTIKQNVQSEVTARSMRLRSTLIPLNHPLIKAGLSLNLKPFGSPTMSDKAMMPFPALKIGPGDSARSHMADEYIFLDDIKNGMDIYIQLLNEILR